MIKSNIFPTKPQINFILFLDLPVLLVKEQGQA